VNRIWVTRQFHELDKIPDTGSTVVKFGCQGGCSGLDRAFVAFADQRAHILLMQ
jgi:hypothetical protein